MLVKHFFDKITSTLTYIVYDEVSRDAVLIDPVLDYSSSDSIISFENIKLYQNFILEKKLSLHFILETHAHADHLSGSQKLKEIFPKSKLAIGQNITQVQKTFRQVYNLEKLKTDGSQFDLLLEDNQTLVAGSIKIKILGTPGHTPACVCYYINQEMIFTGDALFIEDYGTGRCDFPQGSAQQLYQSVTKKIYTLPDETKVYPGHDYQPQGRALRFETTIGIEKEKNIQLSSKTSEQEFIQFRNSRDATLNYPKLLLPSLQVNIQAGHLPPAENNQTSYLKIPLNIKEYK